MKIPRIDACGGTAANLFRLWNDVAADYDLDVSKHAGFARDGAAAIIGRRKSFSQNLTEQNPITYTVHCQVNHLPLNCTDTAKELQHIQDSERGLVKTWRYFLISPLKTEKLHEMQAADIDISKQNMIKACCICWLSHDEAAIAIKAELSAVYATLNYIVSAKKDGAAVEILNAFFFFFTCCTLL